MNRVTSILGPWADFDAIPPAVLANAARRGTAFHAAAAAYARGLFPIVDADFAGFFESFTHWFDRYVKKVYFVEEELIDEVLGFGGHPDIGLQLIDGRNMVVDWKTPAVASGSWPLQVSAYLHLANKKYDGLFGGCMALQPHKSGGPAKATVYNYSHNHFAIFLSALNCYKYFK